MGNELSSGHDFSQCGQHLPRGFNTVVNKTCQTFFQLSSDIPQMKRSKIMTSYITNDNLVVAVDAYGAYSYKLEDGNVRERYLLENPNHIMSASKINDNLILALNVGIIIILDSNLLVLVKEIKPTALLPGVVTYMCEGSNNSIIAGHSSGDITVWDIQTGKLSDEFHAGYPPISVSCIAYSPKYSFVLVGFDNNVKSSNSQTAKPIKIFSTKTDRRVFELAGIKGKALGFSLFESRNILIALDSYERNIMVFDFIGGYELLSTQIPLIFDRNIPTSLFQIPNYYEEDVISIGFSNNKII